MPKLAEVFVLHEAAAKKPPEGMRVQAKKNIDRFDPWEVKKGALGTVKYDKQAGKPVEDGLYVELDEPLHASAGPFKDQTDFVPYNLHILEPSSISGNDPPEVWLRIFWEDWEHAKSN